MEKKPTKREAWPDKGEQGESRTSQHKTWRESVGDTLNTFIADIQLTRSWMPPKVYFFNLALDTFQLRKDLNKAFDYQGKE